MDLRPKAEDHRLIFAYLYGSFNELQKETDIDIAIYALENTEPYGLSADLKIALHKKTGLAPEEFDIRILNNLENSGDLFSLLYLKNVLEPNRLLVDRHPSARSDFSERYGLRFRECEGLMQEVAG